MSHFSRPFRALSGIASAALAFTGIVLLSPISASAAGEVEVVTGNDIRHVENAATYSSWHEGYNNPKRAFFVAEDGLHLGIGAKSQIMKGLDEPAPMSSAALGDLITGAKVTTTAGLATLQVPMFFGPGDPQGFTTLYSADVVTGENTFTLDDTFVSTRDIGDIAKNTPTPLNEILEELSDVRLLGFGVQANATEAGTIVSSLVWDGTTYAFRPFVASAPSKSETVYERDVKSSETPATYTEWHEGKAADGSVVKWDGLHLGVPASSTVIKGTDVWETNGATHEVTKAELLELITSASVEVVSGTATFQVPIKFGTDFGSAVFTTIRSTSLTAGSNAFALNDTWATTRAFGPYGPQGEAALGDLLDSIFAGNNKVWIAGYGVQADSFDPAVVSSLVWNDTKYTFTQPVVFDYADITTGPVATNLDLNGWTFDQTRATGHNDFVEGGLRVWTESNGSSDKAAGYRDVDIKLADVGIPALDLTHNSGVAPSIQLGVDFSGDGVWDGYLVGETVYGDHWWASNSIVNNTGFTGLPTHGGGGGPISGTLDEYLIAYPEADVVSIGYSLGSGVQGDSTIHSITVGGVKYGFRAALVAGTVTISGTPHVGKTLTADPGIWAPEVDSFEYQWFADGEAIAGATDSSFIPTTAELGSKLTVTVTGFKAGYTAESATSLQVVVASGTLAAGTVAITGTPKIGVELTADASAWEPAPVALAYQWNADGVAITGATGATYTPVAADLGAKLSVTVTGTKTGYTTASVTSAETAAVVNGEVTVDRLAGSNRYGTAVEISKSQFPSGADVVYIANGRGYPDALSAAPAAAHNNAPLLLTEQGALPAVIKAELERLQPDEIIIAGGTGVVSAAVETQLKKLSFAPEVRRVAGTNRYGTSIALARDAFGPGSVDTAYLASGLDFPDALSASPAAAHFDGPVILVQGTAKNVSAATLAVLDDLGVDTVKLAGGTGVVSTGIQSQLNAKFGASNVTRNGGSNRYLTAVAINADAFGSSSTVYLANGLGFADALAGAAVAGINDAPLYITPANCVPVQVASAITALGATKVVLLGGTGVLTAAVGNLTVCK